MILGHCAQGRQTHRGIAEFEAEATAYLVAKELELIDWDPAESRAYIHGWLGGAGTTEDNVTRVFAAVNKILTAGRAAAAEAPRNRQDQHHRGLRPVEPDRLLRPRRCP